MLRFFPPHAYTDPFPGNRLAPIPDFDKENDDPMRPTSPPYDLEQVVRDCEASCPLPTLPQSPTPTPIPMTRSNNNSSVTIIINMPTPQSLEVPVEADWRDGAHASEAVWPGPPMPSLPLHRPYPLLLDTTGNVAVSGISLRDVQSRALECERMSRQRTSCGTMTHIVPQLLSFVFG